MDAAYIGEVPPAPPQVSHVRKWLKRLATCLALALLALVGLYFLEGHWANQELEQAVAETERLDPGWRWDELQAARVKLPAGQNSADQLLNARKLLGSSWPPVPPAAAGPDAPEPQTLDQVLAKVPANILLDEDFAAELGQELDRIAPAVVVARRLSELPQGRHPIVLAPDFVSTRMDSIQDARTIATLLRLDAARLSQEGSLDRALDSCRAAINVGRSMNDEQFLIALLCRCACLGQSLTALERTLANGEAGADSTRATQELLQLEERSMQPALLHALRGERAGGQQAVQFLMDGHVSLGRLADTRDDFWTDLLLRAHPGLLKRNQARFLALSTELVELAKLPVQEQPAAVAAWNDRLNQLRVYAPYRTMLASLFLPSSSRTFTAVQRTQAKLRCASVALAAERYRQEQGRWPTALRELYPKHCPEVLVDPFNGQPLRLKKTDEGLAIYSVGVDGSDNDGNLLQQGNQNAEGIDQGFRLWDVGQRRQPAN